MIKSGKSYSYWLARFNRKMAFHFLWVDPLISDRSVWHNGKQPVVYHLPEKSGNFGWNVNGRTIFFFPNGNFHGKMGILER